MRPTWVILALTTMYATVRYNVFKGVPWSDWPVYVLNKSCALSALLLLMLHTVCSWKGRTTGENAGRIKSAALLMFVHAVLSLQILRPAYYEKYFTDGKLTWESGWSMMLGAVAAASIWALSRTCERKDSAAWLTKIGVLALASGLHAALLGYAGWFTPAKWPGYMIPITLISFVAGVVALVAALCTRARQGAGTTERTGSGTARAG